MKDKSTRPTALITGATSGFGYEYAKLFASEGYDLVIVARNKKNLAAVAGEVQAAHGAAVTVISKDLAQPGAPDQIFSQLKKAGITVDVLVNNAGFGTYGLFTEIPIEDEIGEVQLNAVSVMHMTKLFLPGMLKRGSGRILNVASMSSFLPTPMMTVYCSTKAFVLNFSEALAIELKGTGVTVTAVCPGVVITGFQERANNRKAKFNQGRTLDAKTVALISYRAMLKGRPLVVPGALEKVQSVLSQKAPRGLMRSIISGMMMKG